MKQNTYTVYFLLITCQTSKCISILEVLNIACVNLFILYHVCASSFSLFSDHRDTLEIINLTQSSGGNKEQHQREHGAPVNRDYSRCEACERLEGLIAEKKSV